MDIINFISGTPLPNVLVVGGLLFIALSLGSQIGGKIEMPAERQKAAGILGASLLLVGLAFYFLPSVLSSTGAGGGAPPTAESSAGEQAQSDGSASLPGAGDVCFDSYFEEIPGNRIGALETGAQSQVVINASQSKDEPFALQLTQNGQVVGGLIVNFFPDSGLFKIVSVVDAQCEFITSYTNATSGGDPNTLHNWDELELRLSESTYLVDFDHSGGEIKASFELVVE